LAACPHDRRPAAWWQFEATFPYPGYDHEQSTLYEAGVLGEEERAELVAAWREEFETAQAPDFGFVSAPDTRSKARRRGERITDGRIFRAHS
jgi:hypothetical protein